MEFKGKLNDFVFGLNNRLVATFEVDLNNLSVDELNSLKTAKNALKIYIKELKEQRSRNANAYFHALVAKIAEKNYISNDECKVIMNLSCGTPAVDKAGKEVVVKVPESVDIKQFYDYAKFIKETTENGLKSCYYLFYKQTHTLNTKEMARLIDGVVDEAKKLGIQTLDELELQGLIERWGNENKA